MTEPPKITRPRSDERRFIDLQMGVFGGQAFLVAFDIGLFPLVAEAPRTIAEVAREKGLAERSAEALLLLCTSLDLLEKRGDRFVLTPLAEDYLLPESPTYYGDFLRAAVIAQPELTSYPSVKRAILENRSQIYDGDKLFEAHEQQAARAREFTLMMHGHSIAPALTWPNNIDLSETHQMIDIGGGSGAHAIGAALRWPQLSATVLEIPTVCGVAREMIDRYHLQDR
ncbi:MAG: methyltransferase dimerization domain-containing protein, partial [Pseudomonadota bacterium]